MANNNNIVWHHAVITPVHREKLSGHKSFVLWFTGLSGSGKSTLAHYVEERLYQMGCHTFETSLEECVDIVVKYLSDRKFISRNS